MNLQLARIVILGIASLGISAGCVARVETDPAPASGKVDVNVAPPRKANVDVKVD